MWVPSGFGWSRRLGTKPRGSSKPNRWLLGASALQEGIKAVAIGKHGVKPVPESIFGALKEELESVERQLQVFRMELSENCVSASVDVPDMAQVAQRASFIASLFLKHELLPAEGSLILDHVPNKNASLRRGRERNGCYASDVLQMLCPHLLPTSRAFQWGVRLLSADTLNFEEARELAAMVLCCTPETLESPAADAADIISFRALTMHTMRVRHETSEELLGMARASNELINPQYQIRPGIQSTSARNRYAQLAEPFDGFERPGCFLMTPIIGWHLQQRWGIENIVGAVGDSPGPKYGPNLKVVTEQLHERLGPYRDAVRFARGLGDVFLPKTLDERLFVLFDQAWVCPSLHNMLLLRRSIVKRPGWSTVEKFVGCLSGQCSLLIASAFHPPYSQRMVDVAMGLELPGAMIIRKGVEGTLSVSPDSSGAEITCCARRADGTYEQIEMKVKPKLHCAKAGLLSDAESIGPLTASENATLLANYYHSQSSCGHVFFDAVIQATLECIDHGMQWLMDRIGDDLV
ncbi:hypothetical protein CCYA_CCYA07G2051 [Cyanidiococcus yangmingshanensis]|nr:hypothetical protein CCYA_CCYA07G2051 [Cyanidiococcus yangmingshanensis]